MRVRRGGAGCSICIPQSSVKMMSCRMCCLPTLTMLEMAIAISLVSISPGDSDYDSASLSQSSRARDILSPLFRPPKALNERVPANQNHISHARSALVGSCACAPRDRPLVPFRAQRPLEGGVAHADAREPRQRVGFDTCTTDGFSGAPPCTESYPGGGAKCVTSCGAGHRRLWRRAAMLHGKGQYRWRAGGCRCRLQG